MQVINYLQNGLLRRTHVLFDSSLVTTPVIWVNKNDKLSARFKVHFQFADTTDVMNDNEKWDMDQIAVTTDYYQEALKRRRCQISRCQKENDYVTQSDIEITSQYGIEDDQFADFDDFEN